MRATIPFLVFIVLAQQCYAAEIEYRTGGSKHDRAWHQFYVEADHESDIDDSLIAKGKVMVSAICEAVKHKDMKRRRYAIGALGYINERAAMPTLEAILSDESEIDYFRGDALQSIYRIDSKRGLSYAAQYQSQPNTLGQYAKAVIERKPWLL